MGTPLPPAVPDPARFSRIAHGDLPWWNPLGGEDLDAALAAAGPPPGSRVLDVGCGAGGILVRILRARPGSEGVGVDRDEGAIALARIAAAAEGLVARTDFRTEPFAASRFPPAGFDLVLCIGASHAVGTPLEAMRALAPLARPGGAVLFGEGFWEREPDPGYLALLQAKREDLRDFDGTAALGAEAGLDPVASYRSSREEWERYEGAYAANVERYAAANPADPEVPAMLARIRPWREGYLRWGRTTLGFGLYLFRKQA